MSYALKYLIDIPGGEFNRLMRPTHQGDSEHINQVARSLDVYFWEGMLPDDDMEFDVDLTGEWTLCTLPFSYSLILYDSVDSEFRIRIENWERRLRSVMPTQAIFRIDDFLLDQWNVRYDYMLVRNSIAIREFIEWLHTQDSQHWAMVPSDS